MNLNTLKGLNKETNVKHKNLHASIGGKEILKGINLEVKAGEIQIMGPNGAGKVRLRQSSQEMKPMK
jgi:Fe-S cluster assembly ATPase SufC